MTATRLVDTAAAGFIPAERAGAADAAVNDWSGNAFLHDLPLTTLDVFATSFGDGTAGRRTDIAVAGLGFGPVTRAADVAVAGLVAGLANRVAHSLVAGLITRLADGVALIPPAGLANNAIALNRHLLVAGVHDSLAFLVRFRTPDGLFHRLIATAVASTGLAVVLTGLAAFCRTASVAADTAEEASLGFRSAQQREGCH